jgi:predicted enzyme related to lactoylglutathione lyase
MSVFRPGGVSYLEIPAADPGRAAAFYAAVFGWQVEDRGESAAFRDAAGHIIGHWVKARRAAGPAGIVPYVYVDSVDDSLRVATAQGGSQVRAPHGEGDLRVAAFRDPFGNEIGIWQRAQG